MFKGLGGLSDMAGMMKKAQEMQAQMQDMKAELDTVTVTGESGAGLVRAVMTAKGDLKSVDIDPSIFVASEKVIVEDLIVTAVKDAKHKAEAKAAEQTRQVFERLGLPADFKMPF